MDKDRITGAANKVKGAVKDALGSATGDTQNAGRGQAGQGEGLGSGRARPGEGRVARRAQPEQDLTRWHIIEPISRLTAHPSEETRCAASHA